MRRWRPKLCRPLNCWQRPSTFASHFCCPALPPARQLHVWRRDLPRWDWSDAIFNSPDRPGSNPDEWSAILDAALPPHLRIDDSASSAATLNARHVAQVLLAAQYPTDPEVKAVDILHHMAFTAGRWSAVVWLVKMLAEHFLVRHAGKKPLTKLAEQVVGQWPRSGTHSKLTEAAVFLETRESSQQSLPLPSLDHLTLTPPEYTTVEEVFEHDALGQIWRSLGHMTQTCAGGEIKAEILEVIAFLHHKGIMPQSIYHYVTNIDELAIQPPRLLSLLSSRILTSLSDATWRAHEKLIVEGAKRKGEEHAALRPEIPGSMYRVHVAGLTPELWMELILWSCLKGGWVRQGCEILQSLENDSKWKPVSWQDHAQHISQQNGLSDADWDKWEFLFNTKVPDSEPAKLVPRVTRTVSSEVVSAYADALASSVSVGVGLRGSSMDSIVSRLQSLQNFLRSSRRGLSTGTWDALILRIVDYDQSTAEDRSQLTQDLVSLAPNIRLRLRGSARRSSLPEYVSDGNSAMHRLLHRALRRQIDSGSLESALKVLAFHLLRAEIDKAESVKSFLRPPHHSILGHLDGAKPAANMFSGIEYPGFDAQIPSETLASLMHLAMDQGSDDVVEWMINEDHMRGPLVKRQMYTNKHIQPALLRYAAATDNTELFTACVEGSGDRESLLAVLDTQISGKRWKAVDRLFQHLCNTEAISWTPRNLATLCRSMLFLFRDAEAGSESAKRHLDEAQRWFRAMVGFKLEGLEQRSTSRDQKIKSIVSVLSTIDTRWKILCAPFMKHWTHFSFQMITPRLNLIIEGIATAYGSAAARRILGIFWPHRARSAPDNASMFGTRQSTQMRRRRPTSAVSINRQPIIIPKDRPGEKLFIYGSAVPNMRTIMIILDVALQELQDTATTNATPAELPAEKMIRMPETLDANQGNAVDTTLVADEEDAIDLTPTGMVKWAIRRLLQLPELELNLLQRLDSILKDHHIDDVRAELPRLIDEARALPPREDWDVTVEDDEDDDNIDDDDIVDNNNESSRMRRADVSQTAGVSGRGERARNADGGGGLRF